MGKNWGLHTLATTESHVVNDAFLGYDVSLGAARIDRPVVQPEEIDVRST